MLKPFDKYKTVQYDYVSKLPVGWKLLPNIAIFRERKIQNRQNEELLSVTIGQGIIKQSELNKKDSSTVDKSKYLLVYPGDVVYSMRFRQGASGYSLFKGIVSPACTVLKQKPNYEINSKYFAYMFRTSLYKNYVERFSYGIADGQIPLRYKDFKRMYSIVPPIETQNAIVKYIDKKVAQIQDFIKKKERLIELLEEKIRYKVEKVVSFGLRNEVRKITNDRWLKEIPRSWEFSRIKYVAKTNPAKSSSLLVKTLIKEVVFLPMEQVSDKGEISNEIKKNISELGNSFTYFEKDDVLLAKITPCFENGKGAVLHNLITPFGFGSTEFHVLRVSSRILPEFLFQILRLPMFKTLGKQYMKGSAGQQRVPIAFIRNFPIALPNIDEQQEIIEYCKTQFQLLDTSILTAKKEIEILKEYQESLITQLVTGQLEVPSDLEYKNEDLPSYSLVAEENSQYSSIM